MIYLDRKKKLKIIAVLLPILAVTGFIVLKVNIDFFLGLLPKICIFYEITGWQCTGCGNTRSVLALLRGDIIAALGYNISIPLIIFGLLLLYVELVTEAFGKKKLKLFPRKPLSWILFAIFMAGYFVLRNVV